MRVLLAVSLLCRRAVLRDRLLPLPHNPPKHTRPHPAERPMCWRLSFCVSILASSACDSLPGLPSESGERLPISA
jgi:hypothetical protein